MCTWLAYTNKIHIKHEHQYIKIATKILITIKIIIMKTLVMH